MLDWLANNPAKCSPKEPTFFQDLLADVLDQLGRSNEARLIRGMNPVAASSFTKEAEQGTCCRGGHYGGTLGDRWAESSTVKEGPASNSVPSEEILEL